MGIFKDIFKKKKEYNGLEDDGREPKELTTEELYRALKRGGYALREWHAVITELVIRGEKK